MVTSTNQQLVRCFFVLIAYAVVGAKHHKPINGSKEESLFRHIIIKALG
jgi:hypothetical protein